MIWTQLTVSGILIICGVLVKNYPNLIAGYNTLSREEKEKINIDKLSRFFMTGLITIGLVNMFVCITLVLFEVKESNIFLINASLIFLAIIGVSIYGNKNFKTIK